MSNPPSTSLKRHPLEKLWTSLCEAVDEAGDLVRSGGESKYKEGLARVRKVFVNAAKSPIQNI
ncbi:MAG: hypothetical protein HY716_17245 [Planctomycetes bacterium]|nr:hypothetical protein [Planctomycetota bacterium]